jgi:hypothetical protein
MSPEYHLQVRVRIVLLNNHTHLSFLLAIFQKDLLFIEDGNPDVCENGMINFEKLFLLGRCINQIRVSQESRYQLVEIPQVQTFLSSQELVSMSSMQILSMAKICEPPNESPTGSFHLKSRKSFSGSFSNLFRLSNSTDK